MKSRCIWTASAALGAVLLMVAAESSPAQNVYQVSRIACRGCGRTCNRTAPLCPHCATPCPAGELAEAAPGELAPAPETAAEPAVPPSMLAGTYGAPAGPASTAPYMIGDFFGQVGVPIYLGPVFDPATGAIAASPSSMVNRFKMAETTSPIPRDRVYFDYTFYHNVALASEGLDVSTYMPGFEKTFLDGLMSFEMRFPIATTRSSDLFPDADDSVDKTNGEFGNIGMAVKGLFLRRDRFVLAGGLTVIVPTARDVRFFLEAGDPAIGIIDNQSVHLLPFLGAVWTPTDDWFVQSYLQLDLDANGNRVLALHPLRRIGRQWEFGYEQIGRYTEATTLYVDVAAGYWVWRNERNRCITGLAPIVELHLNQGLQDTDVVRDPQQIFNVGAAETMSILDLTAGIRMEIGRRSDVTLGYASPLTTDRQFDGEFRFLFNFHF